MKKFLLGILVGVIIAVLGGVILLFAVARLAERRPEIRADSTLVLRLSGPIPETPPLELPFPFLESRAPQTMFEVWNTLRKARVDPNIKAVALIPEGLAVGWGKLQEIRGALVEFRKSGKPVYAYLEAPGADEYYLATAAERIFLAPEDYMNVKGLRAEAMYLKGGLDKLGIQVEIEAAGKYKDAGDMFSRSSMSPETREVLNSVLDEMYGHLLSVIAESRRKSVEEAGRLMDEGPFLARAAQEKGLVDALAYEDEMFEQLKKRAGLAEIRKVSMRDYALVPAAALKLTGKKRIALVVGEGEILRGDMVPGFVEETVISSDRFAGLLRQVRENRYIDGVIVRVDSPGGDSFASDAILREMKLLSKKKPLVISMSDVAASGGYYISMTGDPVIAYPATFTGSIGVIFGKPNLKGLYDKLGIRRETLKRGRFADIDSDYRPLEDAERKKLREGIDNVYQVFVSRVAEARKKKPGDIEPLAQGRVWMGVQAQRNGLIDELGGMSRALELVKAKAKIARDEQVQIEVYPRRRSLWDTLFTRATEAVAGSPLSSVWETLTRHPPVPSGILRRMPYTIEVK